jgi:predicted component of type VI protein secretion system
LIHFFNVGDFSRDMLTERKDRLESAIASLERERAGLMAKLEARTLTREQIRNLQDFAAEMAKGFDLADQDYATRRRVIEAVDVQGRLAVEDGQKVVHVSCVLGKGILYPESVISESNRPGVSRR